MTTDSPTRAVLAPVDVKELLRVLDQEIAGRTKWADHLPIVGKLQEARAAVESLAAALAATRQANDKLRMAWLSCRDDAARYRWLREQHNNRGSDLAVMYSDGMIEDRHLMDPECVDLDAAVDAAIETEKELNRED